MSAERSGRDRAAWDFIRYASVWEDADLLCEALAPAAKGGRLLSVASAGDNALALLTLDPAEVVAVDLNPAQLACVELRLAAFRRLDHPGVLAFLGVSPSSGRAGTYRGLRDDLSPEARGFWDAHPETVEAGVVHAGKFERYLRGFRRFVLPLVHSGRTIDALREPRTIDGQREFYARRWDTWRWRGMFRLFFSRAVMGRLGRDPALFDHVGGVSTGDRILARTRYALTELPVRPNPYCAYIMTGTYPPEALPRYLRPEHFDAIRARLDRVRLARGGVETADGPFHGFNLSDVFEYMDPAEHARVYGALVDRAAPGARLAYWNMMARRARPDAEAARVRRLESEARALHARDNAWFYSAFHLDEVA
jgi:S-adenosylmethionine-diacylglycerol 3-amino-3-carboxypropyl transferase